MNDIFFTLTCTSWPFQSDSDARSSTLLHVVGSVGNTRVGIPSVQYSHDAGAQSKKHFMVNRHDAVDTLLHVFVAYNDISFLNALPQNASRTAEHGVGDLMLYRRPLPYRCKAEMRGTTASPTFFSGCVLLF